MVKDEVFGVKIPVECPNVSSDILIPKKTWSDQEDYDRQAEKLGGLFIKNFKKFEEESNEEIIKAGPKVKQEV